MRPWDEKKSAALSAACEPATPHLQDGYAASEKIHQLRAASHWNRLPPEA